MNNFALNDEKVISQLGRFGETLVQLINPWMYSVFSRVLLPIKISFKHSFTFFQILYIAWNCVEFGSLLIPFHIPGLSQDDPGKEEKSLPIGAYEPLWTVGWIKTISIYSATLHLWISLPNSVIEKQSVEASRNSEPVNFFCYYFYLLNTCTMII